LKDPCLVWKIWDGLGFWIGIKGQNNSVAKKKKMQFGVGPWNGVLGVAWKMQLVSYFKGEFRV